MKKLGTKERPSPQYGPAGAMMAMDSEKDVNPEYTPTLKEKMIEAVDDEFGLGVVISEQIVETMLATLSEAGRKIVPRAPTSEMHDIGQCRCCETVYCERGIAYVAKPRETWQAMYDAAPGLDDVDD